MAIKYFKSPDNPYASSTQFTAQGDETLVPDYEIDTGKEIMTPAHPVAEVELRRGGYDYPEGNRDILPNVFTDTDEQLQLFDAQPSIITGAFADHRMRSATPVVLGMAINEAQKIGTGLTYSDDLSQHSSKLAKRGIDMGIVTPNKSNIKAAQTNDIAVTGLDTYEEVHTPAYFQDLDEAHPDEVEAGRKTIRGIARQSLEARKSHMGEQFQTTNEQLKLPGFD